MFGHLTPVVRGEILRAACGSDIAPRGLGLRKGTCDVQWSQTATANYGGSDESLHQQAPS
eukprot:1182156-Prorocentrum_minimum.AAC.2